MEDTAHKIPEQYFVTLCLIFKIKLTLSLINSHFISYTKVITSDSKHIISVTCQ